MISSPLGPGGVATIHVAPPSSERKSVDPVVIPASSAKRQVEGAAHVNTTPVAPNKPKPPNGGSTGVRLQSCPSCVESR